MHQILLILAISTLTFTSHLGATDRTPVPKGPLGAEEQQNISVFDRSSPGVVHILSIGLQRNPFSFNVLETPRGSGTGFVWDEKGHIVTNFHVIESGNRAKVTFQNHESVEAEVVGVAPEKDLAVLRIKTKKPLKPIPLGTSADLKVGQKVFAIGNPFGLDQTLTTGIISAIGREIESVTRTPIKDVIQTDAAINPGNSGGPLLDSSGRLIGVNTAIYSPSGAYAGIGFAIPADTVHWVVTELIRYGKITRPFLGVSLLADRVARQLGIRGAIILDVTEGGSAAKAGLIGTHRNRQGDIELGDVVIAVDGKQIRSSQDLLAIIPAYKVGDKVELTIHRNRSTRKITVTLESTP